MNERFNLLLHKYHENMIARGFSPRTIPDYLHNLELFLTYLDEIGITEIEEVDYLIMNDYQIRLLEQTFRDKSISVRTRSRRLSTVRSFFRYLIKTGVANHDPTADLDMPRYPKYLPKDILTKKEMGKLLAQPKLNTPLGIRNRAILEVFYSTGIRVSELCNLTLNEIDIVRGELRVTKGKNAKDRIVPLGEVACDYVEFYLRKARHKLVKNSTQQALFVTNTGKKFLSNNLSYLISNLAKKAGLKKKISTHNLRHTCASHLLKGKADIRYIQEILGHSSLATTQIYTKVDIADLKKVHSKAHPRERKEVPVNDGWS